MIVYAFLLFFLLSPGVLLRLPARASNMKVAAVHSLIFAAIWTLTHKIVWRMSASLEGLVAGKGKAKGKNPTNKPVANKPVANKPLANNSAPQNVGTPAQNTPGDKYRV